MPGHSTGLLVAAAIAAYALYSPMQAFEHGQISAMPQTCQSRMNDIFDSYYNITVLDGTFNCTDVILSNLNNADGVNCSAPEDVRACFNVSNRLRPLTDLSCHSQLASGLWHRLPMPMADLGQFISQLRSSVHSFCLKH